MNSFIKRISLLSIAFVLASCSSIKPNDSQNSNSSRPNVSSDLPSSSDVSSSADSNSSSASSNNISSNWSHTEQLLFSKQLRNPESLSHSYSYNDTLAPEYLTFKDKINSFANKLSEYFAKGNYKSGQNIVISPLSIELCLGLAIRSADGQTREELLNALDIDYQTFNAYYKLLFNEMRKVYKTNTGDVMGEQILTNSIWVDKKVSLLDCGLDALRDDYYCYAYETDFAEHNKEANADLSQFIKESTKGMIDPELSLSPEILFVLMNTLYLKDVWNEGGYDLSTNNAHPFTNSDNTQSSKPLLQGSYLDGRVLSKEDYSAFYTETKNGYTLYFIKPRPGKTANDVFNKENIADVINQDSYILKDDEKEEEYHTRCIFPEYTADADIELTKLFNERFDVKTLFNPTTCNFTNLTNQEVYCSEFRHIAKLEVNKKGIKGAAVTYMAYAGAVGPGPYKQVYENFFVDHEFGFVLMKDNVNIFSGIVTNIDK